MPTTICLSNVPPCCNCSFPDDDDDEGLHAVLGVPSTPQLSINGPWGQDCGTRDSVLPSTENLDVTFFGGLLFKKELNI